MRLCLGFWIQKNSNKKAVFFEIPKSGGIVGKRARNPDNVTRRNEKMSNYVVADGKGALKGVFTKKNLFYKFIAGDEEDKLRLATLEIPSDAVAMPKVDYKSVRNLLDVTNVVEFWREIDGGFERAYRVWECDDNTPFQKVIKTVVPVADTVVAAVPESPVAEVASMGASGLGGAATVVPTVV
jgi:hypothetical protein